MPRPARSEDLTLRLGAVTLGAVLLASAALAADLAREHMAVLGVVCGAGAAPHCAWCYAAAALALAGVTAWAAAFTPARVAARVSRRGSSRRRSGSPRR